MRLVRNLLALIGLLTLVALGAAILVLEPYVNKARSLDEAALGVYAGMARTILETGDPMEAMVYQRSADPGLSVADVETALGRAAAAFELHALGTLPVQQQVLDQTGRSFPLLQIHLFCDPDLASDLIRHNPSMAAFLPCRVIVYEDESGRIWLMTPNLDLVVHGGRPLPLALQERALGLQQTLRAMVDRAAGADS
ncbi:DUF302 domain-containing protein [Thioalkalivibrio sp.]|uniref:DUF302 domain-containing protein n=1 Tax=Thioalkalivibrio sp. TaxID=2093813 RepID=UPI0012D6995C|nr:DUF302 domain-containing protein [Thioalkalivibrio sp.]TVP80379.1 MAG: DUF302 domain-containing protein [Thioalkalivibrio sp.]